MILSTFTITIVEVLNFYLPKLKLYTLHFPFAIIILLLNFCGLKVFSFGFVCMSMRMHATFIQVPMKAQRKHWIPYRQSNRQF